jgi:hypothetical protein
MYNTIKEAWFAATVKAEGYNSSLRIPIFKNEDGTYEIGTAQQEGWEDIGVQEVGSVSGWNIDDCYDENEDTREQRILDFLLENQEELFELFEENC